MGKRGEGRGEREGRIDLQLSTSNGGGTVKS